MCSVTEGEALAELREKTTGVGRKCMKCDEKAFIITRINDPFCRQCFTVYIVHKFRSAIGKSKLVRDGDQVLIAYSGGPSSTALLHLVLEGLSERAHKKLRFKPTILHIDESSVLGLTETERDKNVSQVSEVMKKTGFPCYLSTIEQGLQIFADESQLLSKQVDENLSLHCDEKMADIKSLLSSFKTLTGKEDFIKTLRTQLILTICRQLGFNKVFFGNTNSRLAVNILNDIVQGRGAQVSFGTAFCDNRYKDMMLLRPIRDLSVKEVAIYNKMNDLKSVVIPTLSTMGSTSASIERLTEKFVTGLQSDYLSTVSNIVRTGEKLGSSDVCAEDCICVFCQSSLDTNVGQASALVAVEFSEKISKECGHSVACLESSQSANSGVDSTENRKDIYDNLCYGCRTTVSEMSNADKLPALLVQKMNRQMLKVNIEEFLL